MGDKRGIFLCDCGNVRHYADAVYCGRCGRKLEDIKKTVLTEEIEDLLVRWDQEKGNSASSRLTFAKR